MTCVEDVMTRNVVAVHKEAGPRFLRRHADHSKADGLTAAELMTAPAITIGPEADVAQALSLLEQIGRAAGVVTVRDRLSYPGR
jgi:CBS domain-containing protein